jgi:hypothetical protein
VSCRSASRAARGAAFFLLNVRASMYRSSKRRARERRFHGTLAWVLGGLLAPFGACTFDTQPVRPLAIDQQSRPTLGSNGTDTTRPAFSIAPGDPASSALDSGSTSASSAPLAIDRSTCFSCQTASGQYCGAIGDGCGGELACGECTQAGYSCGGRGIEHVCGAAPDSAACSPLTCTPGGGQYCGVIGDGCGGSLDCGACPAPQGCGAGGVANVCGEPAASSCKPLQCSNAQAQYCGVIGDGCGGAIDCGDCGEGSVCGERAASVCGKPCPLCALNQNCAAATTTVSGTAFTAALRNPDPLYNAWVYVPNLALGSKLPALPGGASCEHCQALRADEVVTSTVTGPDGRFSLRDVPVGRGIPLVVQLGGFRMQTTIDVLPCVDNALPNGSLRLPRTQQEGDIPLTAIATGDEDRPQCLLRKLGIDASEFTNPSGQGRIHLFVSNGAVIDSATPSVAALTGLFSGDSGSLSRYSQVLLPCEGSELLKPDPALENLVAYLNQGGRALATHYSYTWLFAPELASTFTWLPALGPAPTGPLAASIDTQSARGVDFQRWLQATGALTNQSPPQITLAEPHTDIPALAADGGAESWLHSDDPAAVQYFTLETPVSSADGASCGRVAFSDFHMRATHSDGSVFPAECEDGPLTTEEKLLEFALFQLGACTGPMTSALPASPPLAPPAAPPAAIATPPRPPPRLN